LLLIIATGISLSYLIYNWYDIAVNPPNRPSIRVAHHGGGIVNTIPNLRIFAYAFGSGLLLVPIILVSIFRKSKKLFSEKILPLTFFFMYTIVFISSSLSREVAYYYYYSRYCVPFIPIILLLGGIVIERYRPSMRVALAGVCIAAIAPFSLTLATNRDISNMDIQSHREVMASVSNYEPGSIVLLEGVLKYYLFNEISYASNSYVFPKSFFVELEDNSFTQGRRIYEMDMVFNGSDEPEAEPGPVSMVHSNRRTLERWFTGWQEPATLLRPMQSEFWIRTVEIN
jgi:hypothetical protein